MSDKVLIEFHEGGYMRLSVPAQCYRLRRVRVADGL